VPLTATLDGELLASLVIVSDPLTGPALAGANFTVNDALCPAASVTGSAGPITENPAPTMLACEIVTEAELAVTVMDFEALLPVVTFPNASDVALALSDPTAAAPDPESESDATVAGVDVTGVTLPLTAPDVVGANVTVNGTL
jgi:hypothetical protein